MRPKHLAARAWRELRAKPLITEQTAVIEEGVGFAAVYRLVSAQKGQPNVIAKRCPQDTALIERTVYEEILPGLGIPVPRYYGFVKEPGNEFAWIFLEDVSEDKYQPHLEEHRVAAARWLGTMNLAATSVPAARRLPRRGPAHYLKLLGTASDFIRANMSNPVLDSDGRELLENIVKCCQQLAANWQPLERTCEGMPHTLVHGDFISKNVTVRNSSDGLEVLPFDWEKAGWGVPAEDISGVDIGVYWQTVREFWPQFDIDDFKRLAKVGRVFRWLVFLEWIAPRFAREPLEEPMGDMRYYANWLLADLTEATTWRDEAGLQMA